MTDFGWCESDSSEWNFDVRNSQDMHREFNSAGKVLKMTDKKLENYLAVDVENYYQVSAFEKNCRL